MGIGFGTTGAKEYLKILAKKELKDLATAEMKGVIAQAVKEAGEEAVKKTLTGVVKKAGKESAEAFLKEAGEGTLHTVLEQTAKKTVAEGFAQTTLKEGAAALLKKEVRGNGLVWGAMKGTARGAGKATKVLGKTAVAHPLIAGAIIMDQWKNDGRITGGIVELVTSMLPDSDPENMAKVQFVNQDGNAVAIVTDKDGNVTSKDTGQTWEQYQQNRDQIAAQHGIDTGAGASQSGEMIDSLLRKVGLDGVADWIEENGFSKYLGGKTGMLLGGIAMFFLGDNIADLFTGKGAMGGMVSGIAKIILPLAGIAMAGMGGWGLFKDVLGGKPKPPAAITPPTVAPERQQELELDGRGKGRGEPDVTTRAGDPARLREEALALLERTGGGRRVKGGSDASPADRVSPTDLAGIGTTPGHDGNGRGGGAPGSAG